MKHRLLILAMLCILLSGCGTALTAASTVTDAPTSMHVTRVTGPRAHLPSFSPRVVINQQAVQQLYRTILAFPHFSVPNPPGFISCPHEGGMTYQLDFFQNQTFLQEVNIHLGGCRLLEIGKKDIRVYHDAFLHQFALTTGVSEATLFPSPQLPCTPTPHSPCSSAP